MSIENEGGAPDTRPAGHGTDELSAPRQLRQLAEAFTHAAVGIALAVGEEPRLSLVNPALAAMYGRPVEALVGAPIEMLFAPEVRDGVPGFIRRVKEEGRASFETTQIRADGTRFPVLLHITGVRDEAGQLLYRVATVIDLTGDRRAQQAIVESETKYRTLYASMREGVALHELVCDADGRAVDYRFLDVNPAFQRHTGLEPSTVIGRLATEVYGSPAPYVDRYSHVAVSGEPASFEVSFDALGRVFQVSAFPTGPDGFATVFEDVTERRQLEEQFRQAQKMEAIGRLAGGIAHDFNNLLTAILGYSELLLEQPLADSVRSDLLQIRKAGESAAGLTRQLLAFSRKQMLRPELVSLNDVVRDIDTMLRRVIGEDITLVSIPAPGLWPAAADPGQMQQVLLNLAVNARDAMPSGGSLIIETANVSIGHDGAAAGSPPAGDYVSLIVSDTGTGMSAEVQARLFEPFFTTKEPGKGTGLGLSTVYGIVKQSEGHIMVQSEEGRGTTFRILLPRASEAPAADRSAAASGSTAGHETVLVVEDQAPVRALIGKVLRGLGYQVLEAADAAQAETLAANFGGHLDLLLTDLLLGAVNGPELAQRMVAERPDLVVLYISGYADQATMLGVMSSRVAFLHKPFTPDALARKVRLVLDSGDRTRIEPM
jgi:two-component system cell cycle sensor histidine kinase/response regulator CckA